MINYNVTPSNPVGSALKGYRNYLSFREKDDIHKRRVAVEDRLSEENQYRKNVLRPRQTQAWQQGQEDRKVSRQRGDEAHNFLTGQRNRVTEDNRVNDQAVKVFEATHGKYPPGAYGPILDGIEDKKVASAARKLLFEGDKQVLAEMANAQKRLAYDTIDIKNTILADWPKLAQYLKTNYPGISQRMNLDAQNEEQLDQVKDSLLNMTDASYRQLQYGKELYGYKESQKTTKGEKSSITKVQALEKQIKINKALMEINATGGITKETLENMSEEMQKLFMLTGGKIGKQLPKKEKDAYIAKLEELYKDLDQYIPQPERVTIRTTGSVPNTTIPSHDQTKDKKGRASLDSFRGR